MSFSDVMSFNNVIPFIKNNKRQRCWSRIQNVPKTIYVKDATDEEDMSLII